MTIPLPIVVSSIPKGGTEFGVHHCEFKAECRARAVFVAQDRAAAAAAGLDATALAEAGPDDAEALATGTVGHAIMARLFQPDVFEPARSGVLDVEWLKEVIKDPDRFIINDLDKPWTAKADVRIARSAAAYAFCRLAPLLKTSTVIGVELLLRTELNEPLTGALDLAVDLTPEDAARVTGVFGTYLRPGPTIFDWKFIEYLSKSKDSTSGMQHLSYHTLGSRWFPILMGRPVTVANFVYVCIEKTKAKIKEAKHDMMLVSKDLPTAASSAQAMGFLQDRGRVGRLHVLPGDHNLAACVGKYNRPCVYSTEAGGRCDQGLTF